MKYQEGQAGQATQPTASPAPLFSFSPSQPDKSTAPTQTGKRGQASQQAGANRATEGQQEASTAPELWELEQPPYFRLCDFIQAKKGQAQASQQAGANTASNSQPAGTPQPSNPSDLYFIYPEVRHSDVFLSLDIFRKPRNRQAQQRRRTHNIEQGKKGQTGESQVSFKHNFSRFRQQPKHILTEVKLWEIQEASRLKFLPIRQEITAIQQEQKRTGTATEEQRTRLIFLKGQLCPIFRAKASAEAKQQKSLFNGIWEGLGIGTASTPEQPLTPQEASQRRQAKEGREASRQAQAQAYQAIKEALASQPESQQAGTGSQPASRESQQASTGKPAGTGTGTPINKNPTPKREG